MVQTLQAGASPEISAGRDLVGRGGRYESPNAVDRLYTTVLAPQKYVVGGGLSISPYQPSMKILLPDLYQVSGPQFSLNWKKTHHFHQGELLGQDWIEPSGGCKFAPAMAWT